MADVRERRLPYFREASNARCKVSALPCRLMQGDARISRSTLVQTLIDNQIKYLNSQFCALDITLGILPSSETPGRPRPGGVNSSVAVWQQGN